MHPRGATLGEHCQDDALIPKDMGRIGWPIQPPLEPWLEPRILVARDIFLCAARPEVGTYALAAPATAPDAGRGQRAESDGRLVDQLKLDIRVPMRIFAEASYAIFAPLVVDDGARPSILEHPTTGAIANVNSAEFATATQHLETVETQGNYMYLALRVVQVVTQCDHLHDLPLPLPVAGRLPCLRPLLPPSGTGAVAESGERLGEP